jgi:peptidoglycan L-alanyl-D-glutamate endopeptidase CwlK
MPDRPIYRLSALSRRHLAWVHADLVRVVEVAIGLTEVDFRVTEGLRSRKRQDALVRAGASWTSNSRHLTGHAVDLVALVDGAVRWDWPLYYPIAAAMALASRQCGVDLIWGGCWAELRPICSAADAERASVRYAAARHAKGLPARLDGPHFELPRTIT